MRNLTAANQARIDKSLLTLIELGNGEVMRLGEALEAGRFDRRYYRHFEIRPDSYGLMEPGSTAFTPVPKMVFDSVDLDKVIWGA